MNKKRMNRLVKCLSLVVFFAWCASCKNQPTEVKSTEFDIQGHRGARGLMPENSISGFLKAVELGATTLELDLTVTKDNQLLVSHEPFMNSLFCLDPDGNEIAKEDELTYNIYELTVAQIKAYDCGSKYYKRFPDQQKLQISKPLLSEVLEAVNQSIKEKKRKPIRYNIEIKSKPIGDSIFHPRPAAFSELVYHFIKKNMDISRLTVQSFDFRILQHFEKNYPEISLAVLIENTQEIDENIDRLGFTPDIYSCYHHLLDTQTINYLHSLQMQVIPWTVNEKDRMRELIDWGVDGIISDYPDRVVEVLSE